MNLTEQFSNSWTTISASLDFTISLPTFLNSIFLALFGFVIHPSRSMFCFEFTKEANSVFISFLGGGFVYLYSIFNRGFLEFLFERLRHKNADESIEHHVYPGRSWLV